MLEAAKRLNISGRSLRRRLEEEGTSYRVLRQAALFAAACSLLAQRELPLKSIAYRLGFTSPSAFHHAFKRWAKVSPAEYRSRGQADRFSNCQT